MPTPSVCARHSSYLHVLNADTSHRNDNRLAVADHMPDDRLNLILSFETNCCPVRQTRVRLAYTKTVSCLHVRQCPIGQLLGLWSKPLAGVTIKLSLFLRLRSIYFVFHFAKCFVLPSRMRVATHCTCDSHSTFAINKCLFYIDQSWAIGLFYVCFLLRILSALCQLSRHNMSEWGPRCNS